MDGLIEEVGLMEEAGLMAEDWIAKRRELLASTTEGPWQWGEDRAGDTSLSWGDCGPNLETVKRGEVFSDGSQDAEVYVISAWGYDDWGITVKPGDAEWIVDARDSLPLALDALDYVLQLHQSGDEVNGGSDEDEGRYNCTGCCYDHPCPTRQAIEEKLRLSAGRAWGIRGRDFSTRRLSSDVARSARDKQSPS